MIDYKYFYTVSIRGSKDSINSMFSTVFHNIGVDSEFSGNDGLAALKIMENTSSLCFSIYDLLDDTCMQDKIIQEKRANFEQKHHQNAQDGDITFERNIRVTGASVLDDGLEVMMGYYSDGSLFNTSGWVGWDDLCRLYNTTVVIDAVKTKNYHFYGFCGASIYQAMDGVVSKKHLEPKIDISEYIDDFDDLYKIDQKRFRERKIEDLEAKVQRLQTVLSDEKILASCEALDQCNGHLAIPDAIIELNLHNALTKYRHKIRSLYIPATVKTILNEELIPVSNIDSITVSSDNPYFSSANNCILTREGTVLYVGCKGTEIPEGVEVIAPRAFYGCQCLERITIPSCVRHIGDEAFANCTNLRELTIENGVMELGDSAFEGCKALESVVIPESIRKLPRHAFRDCTSLREVTVPENLEYNLGKSFSGTIFGKGAEFNFEDDTPF